MLTIEQRRSKIAQLAAFPPVLRDAVEGLSDHQLDTPYRDNGWTPRQVVHHVFGTMSLDDFLEDYAAPGLRHATQITDLRDRKGW